MQDGGEPPLVGIPIGPRQAEDIRQGFHETYAAKMAACLEARLAIGGHGRRIPQHETELGEQIR
jgi:hypothetical protein